MSGEGHDTGQQGILGCGKLFIGNAGHKGHKGGGAHTAAQVLKGNHARQHVAMLYPIRAKIAKPAVDNACKIPKIHSPRLDPQFK